MSCFKCQGEDCKKLLGKTEFYDLEGLYYCGTCYFEFEKHVCYHCKLIIRDTKYIRLPNKKYFHFNHFKCFKCAKEIPEIITNNNEAFITSFHKDENSDVESTENSIEESVNEQAEIDFASIRHHKTDYEQNFEFSWFNDAPCCLNCFQDIGLRCYKCKEYIHDEYVHLNEGRYHSYCVTCGICNKIVDDYMCKVDKGVFHSKCFMKKYKKCGLCEDYILDQEYYSFRGAVSCWCVNGYFRISMSSVIWTFRRMRGCCMSL